MAVYIYIHTYTQNKYREQEEEEEEPRKPLFLLPTQRIFQTYKIEKLNQKIQRNNEKMEK